MIGRRLVLLCVAVALLGLSPSARSDPPKGAPAARKDRHALLVAVTYYENLPESRHLQGPANDVLLIRKLLLDKLGFSPDQVMVLSEQEGKDRGKDYLPTKANIAREFKRLAKVAKAGDQVMICMGGHGSQQPEDRPAKAKLFGDPALVSDPEPDGKDEIFLPRDVGQWDDGTSTVANAIIDDEVANWLRPFKEKKVSVWITFDSCHSGTMTRGADVEKTRDLDMEKDLGVPKKAIAKAEKEAKEREAKKPEKSRGGEPPAPFKLAGPGGIVALYAAQQIEVTLEREMPPRTEGGKVYGLLSYTMCQVLTESLEHSKEPITYNELAKRIQAQYVAWGRTFPTPMIEGDDKDREILGDKVWPGRSSIQLSTRDGLKVNAGSIHGLTTGSILSVSTPPGQGDKALGFVRLAEVRTFDADAEACDEAGKTKATELPERAVCKVHFIDVGDQRLKVAADPNDGKGQAISDELRKKLAAAVKGLDAPGSVVQPVTKAKEANWLVRSRGADGREVVLVPAAGWSAGRDADVAPSFGPAPVDARLGDWLKDALGRIARAESLKRLAADGKAAGGDVVKIKVELIRRKNKADKRGTFPLPWPGPNVSLYGGDYLAVRFTNTGRVAIDVTALYIDGGCGISCLYPTAGEVNRLFVGDTVTATMGVNSKTVGLEHLVVLAVKGTGPTVDFSSLVQPSLDLAVEKAGTRGGELRQALDSPLGKLLKKGLYGDGNARGMTSDEVDEHALVLVPLHVRPEERPPEPKADK